MVSYPYDLLAAKNKPFNLFNARLEGPPLLLDLSDRNPDTGEVEPGDFDAFQAWTEERLRRAGRHWGLSGWLENRRTILRNFPQMIEEQRFFHAGLDILVPAGSPLHAPLDATVHAAGMDPGPGNYGGYVVLRHRSQIDQSPWYSFYGHLCSDHQVAVGQEVAAGQVFAHIGAGADSGEWFTHTHLQILTQSAVDQGRMTQGYVSAVDLPHIQSLFPCPYPLFRW